jgi:hypothetical protein
LYDYYMTLNKAVEIVKPSWKSIEWEMKISM